MIKIFYRLGNEIMLSRSQTEFATISKENVLWIDILEPTGEEKRATETFLGTEVQSRDRVRGGLPAPGHAGGGLRRVASLV